VIELVGNVGVIERDGMRVVAQRGGGVAVAEAGDSYLLPDAKLGNSGSSAGGHLHQRLGYLGA